jgi:hypothetical protein
VRFVAEAEALGFGKAWPGMGQRPLPDLTLVERALDATTMIIVATAIVNIWTNDAASVAESYERIDARWHARPGSATRPRYAHRLASAAAAQMTGRARPAVPRRSPAQSLPTQGQFSRAADRQTARSRDRRVVRTAIVEELRGISGVEIRERTDPAPTTGRAPVRIQSAGVGP